MTQTFCRLLGFVCYLGWEYQTSFLGIYALMKRAFSSFKQTRDQEWVLSHLFVRDIKLQLLSHWHQSDIMQTQHDQFCPSLSHVTNKAFMNFYLTRTTILYSSVLLSSTYTIEIIIYWSKCHRILETNSCKWAISYYSRWCEG